MGARLDGIEEVAGSNPAGSTTSSLVDQASQIPPPGKIQHESNPQHAIAEEFNKLDFHDDALVSARIRAPRMRKNLTKIDFQFRDDGTKAIKTLSFQSCANIRFVMDFDALAYTWFFGVEGSVAKTDVQRMTKSVRSQMSHWRTAFMPPMSKDQPIRKKLKSIGRYILFQVRFFGGTAEVLANTYRLRR